MRREACTRQLVEKANSEGLWVGQVDDKETGERVQEDFAMFFLPSFLDKRQLEHEWDEEPIQASRLYS